MNYPSPLSFSFCAEASERVKLTTFITMLHLFIINIIASLQFHIFCRYWCMYFGVMSLIG
ncbi:iso-IS1 ORF1 (plasmid) [Escherichia coli B7A]|nr:iso-IS1 ORF1 [Escherichia coli B7A]